MKTSAGLLVHRQRKNGPREVFLVHPGGPFWARKDEHAWSIPKGEIGEGEDGLATARREFTEETGQSVEGTFIELGAHRQPGGKVVQAWAVEGDVAVDRLVSNTFELEWPPRSGKRQTFPEIDRGGWFTLEEARRKIHAGQMPLLDAFERMR